MKKLILLSILILSTMGLAAQCNQPYRAFSTFANDTTAFLRYNFKARADCYKGKTVEYLLKDLQLKPIAIMVSYSTSVGKYDGICIFVDNSKWNIANSQKDQYIYIYWSDLLDNANVIKMGKNYKGVWNQQYYDFFKNMIVGEVKYYK